MYDELLSYLFNAQPHLLAPPMTAWLNSSRRFAAFVDTFRTKIRKKLRTTPENESLLDLQFELETAYLLLQEPTLSVAYEPLPVRQVRGPDFGVSFTTSALFTLEVTRLRAINRDNKIPDPVQAQGQLEERLADMVCGKLGQFMPQHPNILIVGVEASLIKEDVLRAALLRLQQRAERNDPAVVQRHGFSDRADFFRHYQRLSEILVRVPQPKAGESGLGWINPQAKYPLHGKVRTVLYRSQTIS